MNTQRKREFKVALTSGLKALTSAPLHLKVKGLHVDISLRGETTPQGAFDLAFLSRVDGLYLHVGVFGGELSDCLSQLHLPKETNNLLTSGVFFLNTLSEKNREFSPDAGGARLLDATTTPAGLADATIGKIKQFYLPLVEAILTLSPELPAYVVKYAECFSYPLTILAILERLGLEPKFTQIVTTKHDISRFKRERGFDFESLLKGASLPSSVRS